LQCLLQQSLVACYLRPAKRTYVDEVSRIEHNPRLRRTLPRGREIGVRCLDARKNNDIVRASYRSRCSLTDTGGATTRTPKSVNAFNPERRETKSCAANVTSPNSRSNCNRLNIRSEALSRSGVGSQASTTHNCKGVKASFPDFGGYSMPSVSKDRR
jgi:hypothetical protein